MTEPFSFTPVVEADSTTATCQICKTRQTAPDHDQTNWRCRMCGQQYRGGSIVLSDQQLAALRTQAGRAATGTSTLTTNWWTQNDQPVGEDFLVYNKDTPSRRHARSIILNWANGGQIKDVLEIAFGGLHEFRALREPLSSAGVAYRGVDWTDHFVAHAQREFPENQWTQGDIVRGLSVEPADLVYSQHMLEHLPSLEPAFSNMLRLAKKKLINIFFIPPKPFPGYEVVNWQQHPLYHNTYSSGHIEKICQTMGFTYTWTPFPEIQVGGKRVGEDVVLVAERM